MTVPDMRGGRLAALAALDRIRPSSYGKTRNFLDGAVSYLSPYLRHGILSLREVRDAALTRSSRPAVDKFVFELAWRDYYVRVHRLLGDGVWRDLEAYKTGFARDAYATELPDDVANGTTGAACIDAFSASLIATGYVHNHARMWFASYVVHWRRIAWQAGARFFLAHLLDGDPASNNLSWQWVASTFAREPYFFNRQNLQRYTRGAYCERCPLAAGGCPFDATYDVLAPRLFPNGRRAVDTIDAPPMRVAADDACGIPTPITGATIAWVHEEALSHISAARRAAPQAPAIFVWDDEARRRDPWSSRRVRFVEESLTEASLERVARGDASREVARFARDRGARRIVTVDPVDPRLRAIAADLSAEFDLVRLTEPPLVELDRPTDLRRFSRYWRIAARSAFGTAASTGK